jgi:hypothetical protein
MAMMPMMVPMAMMVMMMFPVAMPVPKGAPHYHSWGAIHYRWRGHDHGRARDDHRRQVHDRRRGSNHHWGGIDWNANANGDPNPCVRGQRQGGNHQACPGSPYPKPTRCVLHSVFSCLVSSEDLLSL